MKYAYILLLIAFFSCKNETTQAQNTDVESTSEVEMTKYKSFGASIDDKNMIQSDRLAANYNVLKLNDTINTKAKVKVLDVCQSKGCWMIVDLGDDKTARVKFKDYAFFMPKDIKGKEVIINGKAFVNEMPVDELKHYAEDAGKSEEEIAAITMPERTFSFEADGVLLVE
jgi:hypothetical protein